MKTIIKTSFAFLLFAAIASCTKEDIKSSTTPSLNQTSTQAADGGVEAATVHHIGDAFGGGVIFYLDATGKHGLIAAKRDQGTGVRWYNNGYMLVGNTLSSI